MASATPSKKKSSSTKSKAPIKLNKLILNEISQISKNNNFDVKSLEDFAYFVIEKYKEKDPKPLALTQLKKAIFEHFEVEKIAELKKSGSFQIATSGMNGLNLSKREGWEDIYRKFVGVLPDEENEQGYGCINGINIFKYDLPWRVFGLDPKTATREDIKSAYHKLSSIYHPDKGGDAVIFGRLNVFYKSLTERF